jgi:ASPIC and UnbV.
LPGESKPHRQIDEVRSGGGYFSQNDLRVHFGLGKAEKIDLLEILGLAARPTRSKT